MIKTKQAELLTVNPVCPTSGTVRQESLCCQSFTSAPASSTEKVHLRWSRSNKFNDPVTFLPALFAPGRSHTPGKSRIMRFPVGERAQKPSRKHRKINIQQNSTKRLFARTPVCKIHLTSALRVYSVSHIEKQTKNQKNINYKSFQTHSALSFSKFYRCHICCLRGKN